MAVGQMIMGAIFVLIGLVVIIPLMRKTNGPVWFGVIWTIAAAAGSIFGAINVFSEKGIPTEEIVPTAGKCNHSKTTEERLIGIDSLRKKQLISEEEYNRIRENILKEH